MASRSFICRGLRVVACAWLVSGCGGDAETGPSVVSIRFAKSTASLAIGGASHLDIVAYDARNNPVDLVGQLSWRSSDPARVSVDADGTIHGLALGGPVTISAMAAGKSATAGVIVRPASVEISPRPDSVVVGQSV